MPVNVASTLGNNDCRDDALGGVGVIRRSAGSNSIIDLETLWLLRPLEQGITRIRFKFRPPSSYPPPHRLAEVLGTNQLSTQPASVETSVSSPECPPYTTIGGNGIKFMLYDSSHVLPEPCARGE